MTMFGIFNEYGQCEGGFASRESAERIIATYAPDDGARVSECCPDHDDEERGACSYCDAEGIED